MEITKVPYKEVYENFKEIKGCGDNEEENSKKK